MYTRNFYFLLQHREWISILLPLPGILLIALNAIYFVRANPTNSSGDAGVAGAIFLPSYIISVVIVRVWIEVTGDCFTNSTTKLGTQIRTDLTGLVIATVLLLLKLLTIGMISRSPSGTEVFVIALSDLLSHVLLLLSVGAVSLSFYFVYKAIEIGGRNILLLRVIISAAHSIIYFCFIYYAISTLIDRL